MSKLITVEPTAAGCWVEDTWGHYASQRVCQIAMQAGWEPSEADALIVNNYPDVDDDALMAYSDEIVCDAVDWLNDNLAPRGYRFDWADGGFFLWANEDWASLG